MKKLALIAACLFAMGLGYHDRTSDVKDVPAVFSEGAGK